MGCHCLLRWVAQSFSKYWFFRSKNMVYLSICLCHLWFLSLRRNSFLSTGLLSPYVSLLLSILLFFSYSGKLNCFFNFSFWSFVVSVQKCMRFLHINFVYCNFTISLISSSSFLVSSLGYSIYSIMSSAKSGDLTSFPIEFPLLSFLHLISLTSKTVE